MVSRRAHKLVGWPAVVFNEIITHVQAVIQEDHRQTNYEAAKSFILSRSICHVILHYVLSMHHACDCHVP
jgi:hypothetical protein